MADLSEVERYEIALRRLFQRANPPGSLLRDYEALAQEFLEYVQDTYASDWCDEHQHYIPMGVSCGGH